MGALKQAPRRRNFIPEGEETAAEKAAQLHEQSRREGARQGFRPNFIPPKDYEPPVFLGPEAEAELARQSRERRNAESRQRRWREACQAVVRFGEAEAVAFIRGLPRALMELHILAEEATLNRAGVLGQLPKVGPRAREAWTFDDEKSAEPVTESVDGQAVEASTTDAPEATQAEAPAEAPKQSRPRKKAADPDIAVGPSEDPEDAAAFASIIGASDPADGGDEPEAEASAEADAQPEE
jgi:hypothetical protein